MFSLVRQGSRAPAIRRLFVRHPRILPTSSFVAKPLSQPSDPRARHFSSDEVGTIPGATIRIAPLRRSGEDDGTMRARLLYQSRKRGTLEADLLFSTFADAHLSSMTRQQLEAYDKFLDENDWDTYYWATQDAPADGSTGRAEPTSSGSGGSQSSSDSGSGSGSAGSGGAEMPSKWAREAGEWADTVGAFKPLYRPVPARWKGSDILEMLREHVRTKKVGGMGFMPPLRE